MDNLRGAVAAFRRVVLPVPACSAGAGVAAAGCALPVSASAGRRFLDVVPGPAVLRPVPHGEHAGPRFAAAPVVRPAALRAGAVGRAVAAQRDAGLGGEPQPVADRGIGQLAHCIHGLGRLFRSPDSGLGSGSQGGAHPPRAAGAGRRGGRAVALARAAALPAGLAYSRGHALPVGNLDGDGHIPADAMGGRAERVPDLGRAAAGVPVLRPDTVGLPRRGAAGTVAQPQDAAGGSRAAQRFVWRVHHPGRGPASADGLHHRAGAGVGGDAGDTGAALRVPPACCPARWQC